MARAERSSVVQVQAVRAQEPPIPRERAVAARGRARQRAVGPEEQSPVPAAARVLAAARARAAAQAWLAAEAAARSRP
jgi:hypothetical protein